MAKKTATKAGAAGDVLGALANLIPTTAKPKGKSTKWELPLTDEAKASAERWVSAKVVLDPIQKRADNAKSEFVEYALDVLAEKLLSNKSKPSNPLVVLYKEDNKTVDHQFQILMTDKFKLRFPEVPEDVEARDHFVEIFKAVGLHPIEAERLVDNELDFNSIMGFRMLNEVLEGRYGEGREWIDATEEEKAAARKLVALFSWDGKGKSPEALTLEEKSLLLVRDSGVQVKAGFYDRVTMYCQNKEQLLGIFKIIQPVIYPSYAKFAVSDTPPVKTSRQQKAACDILGVTTEEDGSED